MCIRDRYFILLLKFYYIDHIDYVKQNFVRLSFFILSMTICTYYRIKFLVGHDLRRNIFDNIKYVDQSLESLHVKVPHTRNTIECVLSITDVYKRQLLDCNCSLFKCK